MAKKNLLDMIKNIRGQMLFAWVGVSFENTDGEVQPPKKPLKSFIFVQWLGRKWSMGVDFFGPWGVEPLTHPHLLR